MKKSTLRFFPKIRVRNHRKEKRLGHYCKICCLQKSNQSFSGKGHASHTCKAYTCLSATEQSEAMSINRLMNLPFRRITDNELKWLKKCTGDTREAVRLMAKEIYSQRFSHAERNEMKKQLHIKEIIFTVNSCVWDEYSDEIPLSCRFFMKKTEPVISMQALDVSTEPATIQLEPDKYAKLLKSLIHHYEIFLLESGLLFQQC